MYKNDFFDTGTEVMGIHKVLPLISSNKVDFQRHEIVRGSSLPILKQTHGKLLCTHVFYN